MKGKKWLVVTLQELNMEDGSDYAINFFTFSIWGKAEDNYF